MRTHKLMKRIGGVILSVALAMSLTSVASANYYGIVSTSGTIDGTYFYAKTQGLDSKWSSTTTGENRFILHTTWIQSNASTGLKWIEVGFVDGAMQEPSSSVSYHNGFYTATGSYNSTGTALTSYSEYKITGPSTAVGTNHNYQIQRTGTSSWGVYVDYTLYRTYSDFATSCDGTDVGLETNYSGSTSDEWNERAFQVLKNGSWSSWSNGTIKREDSAQGISVTWDSKPTSIFTEKS